MTRVCAHGCFLCFTGSLLTGNADENATTRFWLFTGEDLPGPSVEAMAIADDTLALFATLPTDYRAVLLLVSVEELTYKEAAMALNIPLGTVMSRLSRARKLLHEKSEGKVSPMSLRRLK